MKRISNLFIVSIITVVIPCALFALSSEERAARMIAIIENTRESSFVSSGVSAPVQPGFVKAVAYGITSSAWKGIKNFPWWDHIGNAISNNKKDIAIFVAGYVVINSVFKRIRSMNDAFDKRCKAISDALGPIKWLMILGTGLAAGSYFGWWGTKAYYA